MPTANATRCLDRNAGATARVVLALVAFSLALSSGCDQLRSRVIDKAAAEQAQGDRRDWLSDGGLHVVLCGTGSPLLDPERAGPCAAVIADGRFFLIDVGTGSWENVQQWKLPRAQLAGIFLTHFHSDHIAELGEAVTQSWIAGRRQVLPVFGPDGVEDVVAGFNQAYAFDRQYRVAHHGVEFMPPEGGEFRSQTLTFAEGQQARALSPDELSPGGGLSVTVFRVDHEPVAPAVGYRFDYNGRSVVISGDTAVSTTLVEASEGVDVLVHEALAAHIMEEVSGSLEQEGASRLAQLARDVLDYHTTPYEAAVAAKQAGAQMLVLTHLVPPIPNRIAARYFLDKVEEAGFDGDIRLGDDGLHIKLPSGSAAIEVHNLD